MGREARKEKLEEEEEGKHNNREGGRQNKSVLVNKKGWYYTKIFLKMFVTILRSVVIFFHFDSLVNNTLKSFIV